jgi:hypothetical protein
MSDPFRDQFARLVGQLLEEAQSRDDSVAAPILAHLGPDAAGFPIHSEELPTYELPNLQLGLEAVLARPGYEHRLVGIAGQSRHFSGLGLSDLMGESRFAVGPPEYVNAPVGPNRTLPCLVWAIALVTGPDGPLCAFVRRGEENGPAPGLSVQVTAADPEVASRFLADLRAAIAEHDVFRGQMITMEVSRRGERRIVFLERPTLGADELVLPEGVLERVERHVVGTSRHREELVRLGRHLGRGLLLWGPPGTGKTHTVRYLAGRLTDATIVILSGATLGMVGAFGPLARRLAPAVIVLEDVDLVAQERTFGFAPFGAAPTLFELMNEMSGLGDDADVAFVLTTNRPDALEPALAARPGRVDLAIEIPLPDADARRRLLELYARGLELTPADLDAVVARTDGVTASFFRELLRKAALLAVDSGRKQVTGDDLTSALDELLDERSALTRVLLGGAADAARRVVPDPHAWLETPR